MTKKISIFMAAVALFSIYLIYEYFLLQSYSPVTHLDQPSQESSSDIFRFNFGLSSSSQSDGKKQERDLMNAEMLNIFKADLQDSLKATPDENSAIMPLMPNNTIRAELGQATWRLLHTMATRFPRDPTPSEQAAFELFVLLISRLYPCGNCAKHFQTILAKKPPNFSSRDHAVLWMCETHNIVNARLGKRQFDCEEAAEAWKCGCADEFLKEEAPVVKEEQDKSINNKNDETNSQVSTPLASQTSFDNQESTNNETRKLD